MSEVYANGHEISAKKDSNKSMGSMPDVCMSPPSPPAGPVPIPYPNFSMGSDTNSGTKKVMIGRKQAGIKNKSDYKKSKGNEAATRNFGMNIISHTISGKMQHARWSMDVTFEGKNVIRQLDLTTHNHGSGGGAVTANGGRFNRVSRKVSCEGLQKENKEAQEKIHPILKTLPQGKTLVTAHYNPPSGPGYRIHGCSHRLEGKNKSNMANGYLDNSGKKYQESKLCREAKKDLRHKKIKRGRHRNQGPRAHAESKIVERLFRKRGANVGGTLVLRIQHKPSGSNNFKTMPCPHCKRMLCAAAKCGLTIMLCTDKNKEPKKHECKE